MVIQQVSQYEENRFGSRINDDDYNNNNNDNNTNQDQSLGIWTCREFLKEKLRVRERYWRKFSHNILPSSIFLPNNDNNNSTTTTKTNLWIIPDGIIWRKFLPLLSHWVDLKVCKLILLESAVDLMDYRNSSPCIQTTTTTTTTNNNNHIENSNINNLSNFIPESSAIRERNKIQKLIRDNPNIVIPFCDLSVREEDDEEYDEWDIMKYSTMSIVERSQHGLIRAGRMIEQLLLDQNTPSFSNNNNNNNTQQVRQNDNNKVVLLSSDLEFIKKFPSSSSSSNNNNENDISIMDTIFIDDFINYFIQQNHNKSIDDQIEKWKQLKDRCEEEYRLRNMSPSTKDSLLELNSREHMSEEEIQTGLANGTLFQGRLTVTKENPKEGVVVINTRSGVGETYFINQQLGHFNRSFHQDIVYIKSLPKSQWGRPVGKRRIVHHRDTTTDDDDHDETTTATTDDDSSSLPIMPSAFVVGIKNTSRRNYVATLVDIPMNDESICLVIPMDMRIPKIRIKTIGGWKKYINQRLLIEIDGWEIGSNYPYGRCIEILGPIADLETEISCLLHEHEVYLEPFSIAALACLPSTPASTTSMTAMTTKKQQKQSEWTIPQEEIMNRKDLRTTHRIFSVDPPGCQDIDDTMHARELPNGDIEVGVHIADVTYFVRHNSPLDKEAQIRGTTFYLVDRRFDMLPSLLSSDLCSLHGSVDRLAVSVIWTMSKDFQDIKSVWYGRTVIHNCQAMTYDQAHNILHNKPPDDPKKAPPPPLTAGSPVNRANIKALKNDLSILTRLSRKLRKDREEIGGAVDLSSGDLEVGRELKFTLDENNNPTRVVAKKELEIHHTIAEMMIFANTSVATKIYNAFPDRALLRIHRSVDEGRLEELKGVLNAGKIAFDGSSNMSLAASLKRAEQNAHGKSGGVVNSLFRSLATRAMSEAQYISTGDSDAKQYLSHYGLGLQQYTHFTSPIRRYADVIVHKQLLLALTIGNLGGLQQSATSAGVHKVKTVPLVSLPESKTISILAGEGLENEPKQKFPNVNPDAPAGSVTKKDPHQRVGEKIVVESNTIQLDNEKTSQTTKYDNSPYNPSDVSRICEGLNRHNRLAKLSSMECQSLFLSLYFKDHTETTNAVVTNLRVNGFWVYVPKFDMRGPVYLCDADGNLQIDPALVGLKPTAGTAPTLGFAASGASRMFSSGKCRLHEVPEEQLVVTVSETSHVFTIRTLDVVSVRICCDNWDVRARVPSPRLHLIAETTRPSPTVNDKPSSAKVIDSQTFKKTGNALNANPRVGMDDCKTLTLYDELLRLHVPPVLEHVLFRCQATTKVNVTGEEKKTTMAGRLVFGDFVNPDTRSATQEAAIQAASEAAAHRRTEVIAKQARDNEYDRTRRIEREVMARTQRLAASKRNTRKSKG